VRCGTCGLLATSPRPTPDLLESLYADTAYHGTRSDPDPAAWAARAQTIVATLPRRPGTVLDFGAGEGHLVAALIGLGIAAEGVEPAATGREVAARDHGIALHSAIPARASGPFDAVLLVHSLEHVPDPVQSLAELRAVLAPDGVVFAEVPHAGSVDMVLPQRRREILDLPFHLHHFTPRTLAAVAARAGFAPLEVRLFNATPVEWALARRAARTRTRRADTPRATPPDATAAADPADPAERSGPAQSRGASLTAAARRTLPGPTFQILLARYP
jgi:SAM-dependent methyltransferase